MKKKRSNKSHSNSPDHNERSFSRRKGERRHTADSSSPHAHQRMASPDSEEQERRHKKRKSKTKHSHRHHRKHKRETRNDSDTTGDGEVKQKVIDEVLRNISVDDMCT